MEAADGDGGFWGNGVCIVMKMNETAFTVFLRAVKDELWVRAVVYRKVESERFV